MKVIKENLESETARLRTLRLVENASMEIVVKEFQSTAAYYKQQYDLLKHEQL